MVIAIISQARYGSTRLPGKVLKPLGNGTVLEYFCNRLKGCKRIDSVIVATSVESQDDPIASLLQQNGIQFSRGSEMNVLERYYEAAKEHGVTTIVRVTSDCPVIAPEVIDQAVELYQRNNWDFFYNNGANQLPHGMDLQVFSFAALEEAYRNATEEDDFEHVVPYIERNPGKFRIGKWVPDRKYPPYRLTLDYSEDYEVMRKIVGAFGENIGYSLDELVAFLNQHPEIAEINGKYSHA